MHDSQHTQHTYNISTFEKLQLNYWGIRKSANTTMKYVLLRAEKPQMVSEIEKRQVNTKNAYGNVTMGWAHNQCKYITPAQATENEFKNFTVLRDPVQRVCSMYYNGLSRPKRVGLSGSIPFRKEITNLFERHQNRPSLLDFVTVIGRYTDEDRNIHYCSQKSHCLLDDIIKLNIETLSSTIKQIHPKLVVDVNLNVSTPHELPDDATLAMIHEVFSEDFTLLNECVL